MLNDEPYTVMRWGNGWAVVRKGDSQPRPVDEKVYSAATNAHRRKRQLNEKAKKLINA